MSTALADPAPLTAEEFLALPADGLRHELVEGVVVTMSPPGIAHGALCLRIARALGNYLEDRPALGTAVSNDTGFVIRRRPDTVLAPDVAFIRRARLADPLAHSGYFDAAPDLAVEVVSPSDRASEVTTKALAWLDAGTRLVWVIDPQARLVTAHEPGAPRQPGEPATASIAHLLRDTDQLDGGDLLPGFTLPLTELFGPRPD